MTTLSPYLFHMLRSLQNRRSFTHASRLLFMSRYNALASYLEPAVKGIFTLCTRLSADVDKH